MAISTQVLTLRKTWPDLLVGISVAGIILPEAVAYAGIANLPPITGIIAACIGLLVYGLVGTSRFAVVAATSSSAAVLAAAIRSMTANDADHAVALAAGLVMVSGVFFLLCALFRLGRIAHFIARPVVRGLALGLAIIIVLRQFAKMVGAPVTHGNAIPLVYDLISSVLHWNGYGLALGAAGLLLLYAFNYWPKIPGPFLVLVIGIAASEALHLHAHGVEIVGAIAISSVLSANSLQLPLLTADEWLRIAELAVALTFILFAESYGAIRATALQRGDDVNVNRDLLALGMANMLAGLLHALPVGAGYSATTANQNIGARSRLAGIAAAIYMIVTIGLLINYVALIPEPLLAAIVIFAMRPALSLQPLRPYLKWRRDHLTVLVAVVAVLTLGVLGGLLAAIAFSLMLLIRGLAQPRISVLGQLGNGHDYVALGSHTDAHAVAGVLIIRPDEPLFFANVDDILANVQQALRKTPNIHTLILSLEESPDIDGTVIEALDHFANRVQQSGCQLLLARIKEPVRAVLKRAQLPMLSETALHTASVAAVVREALATPR